MNLQASLSLLAADPAAPLDLAEVALELARDEYPQLDVEAYLGELDALAHEIRPRLRGRLSTRLNAFVRFLFHDLGFHGNQRDYYDPRNSYLNEVIDRRTGLPITLSVIAIAVGHRARLPVAGVGLPGHFVAKVQEGQEQILFDPFYEGRILTPEHCEAQVEQVLGAPFQASPEALAALPTGLIIQRMLNNLKLIYLQQEDFPRAARIIERLRQLCPDDVLQLRDLGAVLLRAGRPGPAASHLQAYLRTTPAPADAPDVHRLLDRAWGAIARWN